jgi:hypothetical protein
MLESVSIEPIHFMFWKRNNIKIFLFLVLYIIGCSQPSRCKRPQLQTTDFIKKLSNQIKEKDSVSRWRLISERTFVSRTNPNDTVLIDYKGNILDYSIILQLKENDYVSQSAFGDLNGDGMEDLLLLTSNEQNLLSLIILINTGNGYSFKTRNDKMIGDYTDCPMKIEEMKIQYPDFSFSFSSATSIDSYSNFSQTYTFTYDKINKNWFLKEYYQKTTEYAWSAKTKSYSTEKKEKELQLTSKDFGIISFNKTISMLKWDYPLPCINGKQKRRIYSKRI